MIKAADWWVPGRKIFCYTKGTDYWPFWWSQIRPLWQARCAARCGSASGKRRNAPDGWIWPPEGRSIASAGRRYAALVIGRTKAWSMLIATWVRTNPCCYPTLETIRMNDGSADFADLVWSGTYSTCVALWMNNMCH